MKGPLSLAVRSDTGCVRPGNEDSCRGVLSKPNDSLPFGLLGVAIVADGMGGHIGGELASQTAVEVIETALRTSEGWPSLASALRNAVAIANEKVFALADEGTDRRPGTTLTVLAIGPSEYSVIHVGDSRAYLLRSGQLRQLTTDHTKIAEEVAAGRLSAKEAAESPLRHYLSRAVGNEATVEAELVSGEWQQGDTFLLCSDGLSEYIDESELQSQLGSARSIDEIAQDLIDTAKARGGADNITVAVLKCDAEPTQSGLSSRQRHADTATLDLSQPIGDFQ